MNVKYCLFCYFQINLLVNSGATYLFEHFSIKNDLPLKGLIDFACIWVNRKLALLFIYFFKICFTLNLLLPMKLTLIFRVWFGSKCGYSRYFKWKVNCFWEKTVYIFFIKMRMQIHTPSLKNINILDIIVNYFPISH